MLLVSSKYRGKKEFLLVYTELITAAKYKGTVTYQEIAKLIGFPLVGNHMGTEIGHILGEISDDEVNAGRPMLSAVVINAQGMPGPGFFDLARLLKKLNDDSKQSEKEFWEKELAEVHKCWNVILKD